MHTRLLILLVLFFANARLNASVDQSSLPTSSEEQVNDWENQLRDVKYKLKKTLPSTKQAEIFKSFRAKLLADINSSKDMESPLFEKKIVVFNRMNALFLENFKRENCPSIKSRWTLLKSGETENKFEAQQIEEWLNLICR